MLKRLDAFGGANSMPRMLLAAALSLCLSALVVIALRWGAADAGMQYANHELVRWGAVPPSLESWLDVRHRLTDAHQLEPHSATVLEALGLLHAQRVTGGSGSQVFQEQALGYFRKAAALRPTSSYTWANIALTKHRLNEVDAELRGALSNAVMLGPWEPEVQMVVADAGFSLWDELPDASRSEVLEMAVRGMKRYSGSMLRIAETRGRLALLCQSNVASGASDLENITFANAKCQPTPASR